MRKILFRGKLYNGDWCFGNLFIPDKDDAPTEICIGTNVIRITYDVIHETVGQYTGLTDKNGTKIFEGDIVKVVGAPWEYVVKWQFCSFMIITKEDDYATYLDGIDDYEVIGNIHDNPEWLKGGAE